MKDKKPRLVFWDIETIQNLVAVFSLGKNDWIDPSAIVQEGYIVSASWKFEGEDKLHSVSVLDNSELYTEDPHNDKHVVETLHKVLVESDVLVHHNGDDFDLRWLNTRILYHGLTPLPPMTTVDTYKVAKSKFRFNSNKLDYLARYLKVGKKKSTTPGLWMRVLRGDKKAIREMVVYNKHDIVILEAVYKKLLPFIPNAVNRQLYGGIGCPRCSSKKVQSRGTQVAVTRTYQRFQCTSCGGWFRQVKADKGSTTEHRVL